MMADLAADEEAFVQVEGIEMMTEYLTVIKKNLIETDYVPNVEKIIKKAMDSVTPNEIRVKVAKLSGKIIDRFSYAMIAEKHFDLFFQYFKVAIFDKLDDVRIAVAYNLPCFYFTFASMNDDIQKYFE